MTDFWQYLIAFWIAGALLSMWKIYFPSLKIINEVCTEGWPNAIDKSLALWKVEDLR